MTTAERQDTTTSPSARRGRGIALIVGAVVLALLVKQPARGFELPTAFIDYYWFPLMLGVIYLAGAIAGRSRGTLWAPGLMTTAAGVAIALWIRDGRPFDFQFLALTILALGLGAVLAAALAEVGGLAISAMSIATMLLLFGGFLLAEQQGIALITGSTYVYALGLLLWGAYELRPARD